MKYLAILFCCSAISLQAAPPAVSITLSFKWYPGQGELAGLSTNDYLTNIVFNLVSTPDVTMPTNQWPVFATWTATQFTNQGPAGSVWTNTITMADQSRFFAIVVSNIAVGAVSPFSNLAPWFQPPIPGVLLPLRR